MPTLSVINMLIKETLSTSIGILFFENGGFFGSQFCLPFTSTAFLCNVYAGFTSSPHVSGCFWRMEKFIAVFSQKVSAYAKRIRIVFESVCD